MKAHASINWKDTDICLSLFCDCGCESHVDAWGCFYVRCPRCGKIWTPGREVTLEEAKDPGRAYTVHDATVPSDIDEE